MSRLGKKPVPVQSADVKIDGRNVIISKGNATLEFEHRPEIAVTFNEDEKQLEVSLAEGANESVKQNRAYWGTTRAVLANMIHGVITGYEKKLDVVGVGYTAQVSGQNLNLKVGFANTITVPIPSDLDVKVEAQIITVRGADKQAVGQFAAKVRAKRKPEPYNGKGIMYFGEQIIRKQGKAFGS